MTVPPGPLVQSRSWCLLLDCLCTLTRRKRPNTSHRHYLFANRCSLMAMQHRPEHYRRAVRVYQEEEEPVIGVSHLATHLEANILLVSWLRRQGSDLGDDSR